MDEYTDSMLDPAYARQRQQRLLQHLQAHHLDVAVIGTPSHVAYFTTHLPFWLHEAAFVLRADGRSFLVAAAGSSKAPAVDEVIDYEATWHGTQRDRQPLIVAERVAARLGDLSGKRAGADASAVTSALGGVGLLPVRSLEEALLLMRRRKDPDELVLMKKAIACAEAMYRRAWQIVEPGIPELRVFAELHRVAVETAGEPLSAYLGNDYACGAMGGPPRGDHLAEAGQIYILDLGPAYRGYFSDSARSLCVNRKPTHEQSRAAAALHEVFPLIERLARPGARCKDLYAAVDALLRDTYGAGLVHHLGHGVGLQPHEFPHLNPHWDDVLSEGDVFTCEPGLYNPALAAGLRIENTYWVTGTGVQNLTPFPMELA